MDNNKRNIKILKWEKPKIKNLKITKTFGGANATTYESGAVYHS